jgi:hypothetical protein
VADRHEFRVEIEGIQLDQRTLARINEAIQGAALSAMATLDFKGDFAARIGDGGTDGIQIVALPGDVAERVGLKRREAEQR